jgi:lactate dehydrogenase-like 2-hydroxyacid dehydrogenase
MEGSMDTTFLPLEELLATSDVVSLHTPLTPETYHLITDKELGLMKKTAILINTARGPVVDEEALIRYLTDGKLVGAGLDVFEHEPHIPEALLSMDQVVVVPHIGTATHETRHEIAWVAAKNLIDYFSGHKPRYMVNPEIYRPINH